MEFRGLIVKRRFGSGTKSDHFAVWLDQPTGPPLVLRRPGESAYEDSLLNGLVGKNVICHGALTRNNPLFVADIRVVDRVGD